MTQKACEIPERKEYMQKASFTILADNISK